MSDELELKKEMPAPQDNAEGEDGKTTSRLWLALVKMKDGSKNLIEKNLLQDFRTALNDPEIIEVEKIYRGFQKEFKLKTEVVRTLSL